MQPRSKLEKFIWSLQQLMKIDAMNLVILVIITLIGWSIISESIDNPGRYPKLELCNLNPVTGYYAEQALPLYTLLYTIHYLLYIV